MPPASHLVSGAVLSGQAFAWASSDETVATVDGSGRVTGQGDFDYGDDPEGWDAAITSVLGADFP